MQVVLDRVRLFQGDREEDFSEPRRSQTGAADDRWRTRTPLVSPEEKTAVDAPSTPDNRDATKVSAVHSTH